MSLDFYLPGLPAVAAGLQTPLPVAQLSLSACMIGLGVGQLVTGPLTDRYGRRRLLIAGVAMFMLTSGLSAVAPTIEVLLVLRLLGGLGGGAGVVIARSMARDLYSGPALAGVYSQLMLVTASAAVAGPVLAGQALRFTTWRGVFVLLAVIGFVLLVIALAQGETLPPHRRSAVTGGEVLRTLGGLLRDRSFLVPTSALGFGISAMFTYMAMASFVFQQSYGLSPQAFSVLSAGNATGVVVLSLLSAALAPRVGPLRLLATGAGLACVAAGLLVAGVMLSDSVVIVLGPLFILVSCTGLIAPNATALALQHQGHRAGSASALVGLSYYGFAALIPPVASALAGVSPQVLGMTTLATTTVTVLICVVARSDARRRRADEPVPSEPDTLVAPREPDSAPAHRTGGSPADRPAVGPWDTRLPSHPPVTETGPAAASRPPVAASPWEEDADPPARPTQWRHPLDPRRVEARLGRPPTNAPSSEPDLDVEQRWLWIAERARRARLALEETDRLSAVDTNPGR
ncbi:Bcr/CflA family efflux MFS transporter [Pseudonocardia sp. S2-4]|uniref:Bcr/CflA family efflux MFS transporter n=1 Tax=Pseudonocardia humida TaxID=2800819 RepID=A0ABT0ZXC7_9PSEU|nr:Bcr/CflA family efflux MFS transporter [Pseudonocardia humida]